MQYFPSAFEHPVALGGFRSWCRLLASSERIDRAYRARLLAVSAVTLLTSPLRLYEAARHGATVRRTRVHPSPLFILGHWRTGTTHLHNLLAQDPQFGFVSTFQAMAPGFCLTGEKSIKPLLARLAAKRHPTREIDNIPLALDAPQEESFAMANLSPWAWLHIYTLPRQASEIFAKYALLEGLTSGQRAEWRAAYLTVLRKATLRSAGRPLVLKDPANTGRVRELLAMFPEARFVHITRDPYRVLPSMLGVWKVVLAKSQLQSVSAEEVEAYVLEFYQRLLRRFLADKSCIPPGRLVEVRFEDLEAAPLAQLERIYDGLGLRDFAAVRPALAAYVESVRGFQKNRYEVDARVIARVNEHWRFAFDAWDYPMRPSLPVASLASR
jgi:omega-hydroxy-beta-dihydromenaquinone-9 sulfotransferase